MRVFQKISADQAFIIAGPDLFPQKSVILDLLQIGKGQIFPVQPAVQHIDRIEKAFRITAEVRFPVLELHRIDRRLKRLRIQSFLSEFCKRLPYQPAEALFI